MTNPILGMFARPFQQRRNARKLIIDNPAGIREERFVHIGGIEQWVTIRGQNRDKPVIVILHGGPASPYTPFNSWLGSWERELTVVQWDQRGAGKTFRRQGPSGCGPLSFDRLASDGIELVEYVRQRLGKDRVILLGSSIGSLIGLRMIRQRPDLFAAYVGADQNGPAGFAASYRLTLAAAGRAGRRRAVAWLEAMGADPSSWTHKQHLGMNKLAIDLTQDAPHMVGDLMLPALLFAPGMTMADIKAVQKGMNFSASQLFGEMMGYDFDTLGYTFDIPFFVIQGEHDLITPPETARAYVARIQAPRKGFLTISHAAHLVEFCNPEAFLKALQSELLAKVESPLTAALGVL